MWFKNLQLHRLSAPWSLAAEEVEACLARHAFFPGTSLEMQTQGWASPRDNGALVHQVGKQLLLTMRTEKKLLPSTVVNQVTKARAVELEEQQGFKPGRKQMRELKEQITEELLPRAFSIRRDTRVWIDPVNGWLAIDAAAPAKADEVRGLLFKAIHPLDAEDLRRHIAAGKRCTRLAMTWNDRVSFVLTESLTIKRVAPLDVIKEQADPSARDDEERFDGDFTMMAGELANLLSDLTAALGGERKL
ncbi:recombination associated protein [Cupriavidus basilensis OR16]|uniref:Recombination-associated protein RdgC n=1 Tax=Cupriavidus basilensis OR16 TaxID=1127483 RepID=H1SE78_9BURK|nr:recombination-associated protein RdgC [Cupriavidus basilensis]EHP39165.1 recombination associated protein [Cupriavidus basilensis OR16]